MTTPARHRRRRPPGGDFLEERARLTRVPHDCGDCGEEIHAGERARYLVGVIAGTFFYQYGCFICVRNSGG